MLWLLTLTLCGIGLVMVASTTSTFGENAPTATYVIRQAPPWCWG